MTEAIQCINAEGLKTAVLSNNFFVHSGESFLPVDRSQFNVVSRHHCCRPNTRYTTVYCFYCQQWSYRGSRDSCHTCGVWCLRDPNVPHPHKHTNSKRQLVDGGGPTTDVLLGPQGASCYTSIPCHQQNTIIFVNYKIFQFYFSSILLYCLLFNLQNFLFLQIVESCIEGICKPDPRIYQLCAKRLGVQPTEAIFLDDIGQNLKAAAQLGFHTIKVGGCKCTVICDLGAQEKRQFAKNKNSVLVTETH